MNRVLKEYMENVRPALMKKFSYTSIMQVPKIEKIVVNMGVGDAIQNSKLLDAAVEDLTQITGQRPVITKAKKSIANFKLRQNVAIGCKVTLRGERMYHFFDKLISIALPRSGSEALVRIPLMAGNYKIGIKEQLIFPKSAMTKF